jgi:hypothetical protein
MPRELQTVLKKYRHTRALAVVSSQELVARPTMAHALACLASPELARALVLIRVLCSPA